MVSYILSRKCQPRTTDNDVSSQELQDYIERLIDVNGNMDSSSLQIYYFLQGSTFCIDLIYCLVQAAIAHHYLDIPLFIQCLFTISLVYSLKDAINIDTVSSTSRQQNQTITQSNRSSGISRWLFGKELLEEMMFEKEQDFCSPFRTHHDETKENLNFLTIAANYCLKHVNFDLKAKQIPDFFSFSLIRKKIEHQIIAQYFCDDLDLNGLAIMKKKDLIHLLEQEIAKFIKKAHKVTTGLQTGMGQQIINETTPTLDETSKQESNPGEIEEACAAIANCEPDKSRLRNGIVERSNESVTNKPHDGSGLLNKGRAVSDSILVQPLAPEQQSSSDENVKKCTATDHYVTVSSTEGQRELLKLPNDLGEAERVTCSGVIGVTPLLVEEESSSSVHYADDMCNHDGTADGSHVEPQESSFRKSLCVAALQVSLLPDNPHDQLTITDMAKSRDKTTSQTSQLNCHEESAGNVLLNKEQEQFSESETIASYNYQELYQCTKGFDIRPVKEGGCRIGFGSYGEVFCCSMAVANGGVKVLAIKRMKQPKTSKLSHIKVSRRQFSAELMAMTRCRHPNIVRLVGQCTEGPQLCLVYEFVSGGNLELLLRKDNPSPPLWHFRLTLMRDIACALEYLHTTCKPAVVHRDVKNANILVTEDRRAKLADFGLSITVDDEEDPLTSFNVTSAVGTRSYMAPEAYKGKVSPKIDIYSFGVLLYELITGLPPFSTVTKKDLVTYMRDLEREGCDPAVLVDPRAKWISDVSSDLLKLSRWTTDYDSHNRPLMTVVVSILNMLVRDFHPGDPV